MLLPLQDFRKKYEHILRVASRSGGCSIYIFVTNDTDSICALKTLTVPPFLFDSLNRTF